uniref:Archaemetzincin-2 n=1 Tax=Pan paniscus TaxID=9597 RepID=A0A2R8ZJX1_PANPA
MQIVRYSEQTLKIAVISKNPVLVSQYEKVDAGEQRLMNEAFQPANWITSHPEAPQDFEQFFSHPYRKTPSPDKRSIYIQSIGKYCTRIISEEYIKWLTGYCKAYFYRLRVKLLKPVPVSTTRCSFRVNENTQNLQIHAGDILKFLKKKKPEDAFCVVGITMIDLYPRDLWNFVFGQASLTDGIPFLELCMVILGMGKVLETGHIFNLFLEIWGFFHLEEADRHPLNLGPICLHKLQCAIGFSIVERYKALVRWIDDESSGTPGATPEHSREDNGNLVKPEWKEWIIKCLTVLQK